MVCEKLGFSKTTLWSKGNPKSKYYDPKFPKKIKLGPKMVGWLEDQIDQWLEHKILMSLELTN